MSQPPDLRPCAGTQSRRQPDRRRQAHYVRGMFSRIADHYDLMNTLMTFGQDEHWRAVVIRAAGPVAGQWTLDVGTGTGGSPATWPGAGRGRSAST